MSANPITWVGMDAHKNSIKVAAWLPGQADPVEWTEDTTAEAIRRLGRRLRRLAPGEVRACYEAGPTGGWCRARTPAASASSAGPSPSPATGTCVDCWSRPPGITDIGPL